MPSTRFGMKIRSGMYFSGSTWVFMTAVVVEMVVSPGALVAPAPVVVDPLVFGTVVVVVGVSRGWSVWWPSRRSAV